MDNHIYYISQAIEEAWKAYEKQEAPIGAIIVKDDAIIARAHNLRESEKSAIAHAEILAIQKACKHLGAWRLIDCDMYVTLEPCVMCAGAIMQSRIRNLIIGTLDPKAGAVGSVVNILEVPQFNHRVNVITDVLQKQCAMPLKQFFKELRDKK